MTAGSVLVALCPTARIVSLVKLVVLVFLGVSLSDVAGLHVFCGERTWGVRGSIVVGTVLVENLLDFLSEAAHFGCR
jgi:hypothetical protein